MNLFIDTHLNDVVIFLFNEKKIVKFKQITDEKQNSKHIMPIVKKILGKNTPDSIVVVNGPGSFTGVRLGVTIAKTLSHTLKVPIRTITSLECLAISIDFEDRIVAFSDKNGYYIGIFDNNMNLIGNYEYLSNKQFMEFKAKYHVFTDIDINYNKVVEYVMNKETINPHEVNPVYIKKLDVEK